MTALTPPLAQPIPVDFRIAEKAQDMAADAIQDEAETKTDNEVKKTAKAKRKAEKRKRKAS